MVIERRTSVHDPALGHRTVDVTLTVRSPDGQPVGGAPVVVEQRSHAFRFACIGFDLTGLADGETGRDGPDRDESLAGLWLDLFNAATPPFYWGDSEPVRGRPDTQRLLRAARWFADRGCAVKGHPLIRIDALGLQTHMHQGCWGEERTLATIDRFARYGLPIHLTESTLLSGELMPPEIEDLNDDVVSHWPSTPEGEARQSDEVVRHYRTLLSHPAVQPPAERRGEDGGQPGGEARQALLVHQRRDAEPAARHDVALRGRDAPRPHLRGDGGRAERP